MVLSETSDFNWRVIGIPAGGAGEGSQNQPRGRGEGSKGRAMKRAPLITDKEFRVTVKMAREYSATIKVWATDQAEADQMALDLFEEHVYDINGAHGVSLGLPPPWDEHESHDYDPEIDTISRCVDCGKETIGCGEYYRVSDELWAASGISPGSGMLCLSCLEKRIGRPLTLEDFIAVLPSREAWARHVRARAAGV